MNYTENYHLPQWKKEDRIMMDDFNAAMAGIDSGIAQAQASADTAIGDAARLPYVVGTYVGDGTNDRHISLGFRASFIIVSGQAEAHVAGSGADLYFVATAGTAFSYLFSVTDDGFLVNSFINDRPNLNALDRTYDYIAFR